MDIAPNSAFYHLYIYCPAPLGSFLYVKFHSIALFKGIKTHTLQGGAVEENFSAIFSADEAESPSSDKSLNSSFQAFTSSLYKNSAKPLSEACGETFLQINDFQF